MSGGNLGPPGSVPGVPFEDGPDPRRGGGKKGHSGRPSNDAIDIARTILRDAKYDVSVVRILTDPDHKHFAAVLKVVLAYAYGQPKQTLSIEGDVPILRIIRDQAAVQAQVRPVDEDDA